CRVLCIKVIAKFSLTNATYNFSFVGCSVIFTLKQKLSAQQSLCSLHLQLPSRSLLFLTCRHASVSCHGSTRTGSKQSCVNCVQIFYCINLGHNNLIE